MNPITSDDIAAELAALDVKINALLPPRYQHCYTSVPPTSMGSAGLKFGPDGKVAWDQIWTSFCDLALAGGPPHRGKLLEPVDPAEVAAQPDRHREVVAELDRALGLTVGAAVLPGESPGWIEIPCGSLAESAWLQFAITAENVSARRRRTFLQLPAGPSFRIEKEIKNVVVAFSKSVHYWDGHLTSSQQTLAGHEPWEAASPAEAAANPQAYATAHAAMHEALSTAGFTLTPPRYTGWIGLELRDDDEAVWLLRATLVEQVLARREEHILYLPIGLNLAPARAASIGRSLGRARLLMTAATTRRPSA